MGINGLLIYLEMLILQKSGAMGGDREKKLSDIKNEWMEDIMDIEFEGILVKAPVKTHEILVHSYGEDYMTPPPVEQRIPKHPASYIKF